MLVQVLVVLHVLTAMYWFGNASVMPRRLRGILELDPDNARKALAGLKHDALGLPMSGLIVLATGLGLVFALGGFKAVHPRIHAGLGLTLVWLLVGALLFRPAAMRFGRAIVEGDLEGARRQVKRASAALGITHLLFVIIAVLMMWRL